MKWLITGGAGFIGLAAARILRDRGDDVVLVDDFSRFGGVSTSCGYLRLRAIRDEGFDVRVEDVTSGLPGIVPMNGLRDADVVLHLAAQAAVTESVANPLRDARTNVMGTLNVLDEASRYMDNPIVIYASTNKVYGTLAGWPARLPIPEGREIDPRTPYGVSKAAGQMYVHDYAKSRGLRAVSLVQSCCYGPSQVESASFGQGWMAHMALEAARTGRVTICGDGMQVRDALHVDDLVRAYIAVAEGSPPPSWGMHFNVGGGPENAISVVEWVDFLEEYLGRPISREFADERPSDQRWYVSDTSLFESVYGWKPSIDVFEGGKHLAAAARSFVVGQEGADLVAR